MFYGSNCNRKSKLSGLLTEPLNPRERGARGDLVWITCHSSTQERIEVRIL